MPLCSKEHQNFVHLSYGSTLKINLFVDHTKVNLLYTPDWDRKDRVILEQGELVVPLDPSLDGRLTVEGPMCILERVRVSDMGLFRVTDLLGFPVTNIYLEVKGKPWVREETRALTYRSIYHLY